MLVYQQLAVGQIGVKLGDVGVFVGDITCAAEVVGVIEENVLGVGGICWDITIARLGIIRVFGLLPLDGRPWNISLFIELRSLHPTFRHGVVAQIPDNLVITATDVVGIGLYVVKPKCTTANIVIYSVVSFFYSQKFFC